MDLEDEDGMESFDISETDLEFALNPNSRRRLSKNQQLYGIWAEREESDEEDSYAGFGASTSKKRTKNYSAPMNFVSGGVKHGDKMEIENKDAEVDDEDGVIVIEKRVRHQKRRAGANVFAGMRTTAQHGSIDPEKFADWAKHSKSDIIMKMMRKMGYVPGQGLGANKQGIVEPIQAVVRPGRAAVGAYGKESVGPKFGESAAESQRRFDDPDAEIVTQEQKRMNWKKSNVKKAANYKYKTIDEVIAEGGVLKKRFDPVNAGVKVIDMTGREQKIYSGYDAYAAKTRSVADVEAFQLKFDVPELMHNLNLLIDESEECIRRNDRQMRFLKDQTAALENDRDQIINVLSKERDEQQRMEKLYTLLERFSTRSECGEITLDDCQNLFDELKKSFLQEYRLFKLEEIAIASVLPLIKQYLSSWNPLDNQKTDYGFSLLSKWKSILEIEPRSVLSTTKSLENLTPFERLLWDAWMPLIRQAVLRWNPRDDSRPMLAVVQKWLPLLPIWMRENLLEQVIIPRIAAQVDEWNPMIDRIPIHSWLHPWFDILGDRLQSVFSPMRQKLAKALKEWTPSDRSALSMLRPWKECFGPATMSAFLAMNIIPKLEKSLREMVYDPTKNNRYDEFYATLEWSDLLGLDCVATILVRNFFPKWYETLCVWLDAPQVVVQEVAMWYNEWKERIPGEIASFTIIQEQLRRALIAMKNAQQGIRVSQQPSVPPPSVEAIHAMFHPPPPPKIPPPPQLSFKDLVELRARDAGILYAPQVNKFRDGKPVYWFGNTSIFIDRNVIFAFNVKTQQWSPIGLEHLLSIC